jgi:hypothetical protein
MTREDNMKIIFFILFCILVSGCTGIGKAPSFESFSKFEKGCGLRFLKGDVVTRLSIADNGELTFESGYRKMATDPSGPKVVSLRVEPYKEGKVLLSIFSKSTGKKIVVGSISLRDMEVLKKECPIIDR